MPIFKTDGKLIYYAHVPKCGGSAVEQYLAARFGHVAFQNTAYLALPPARRWTRTSPQHVDAAALGLLFPPGFFDASFAIVRHPVGRMVSAYHFQLEVEKSIPAGTGFRDWLEDLADLMAEQPFAFDNHIRPMADLVPEGATVFYLEHGLDALVPWLDAITGTAEGPRAIAHVNKRNEYARTNTAKVTPGADEIALIARLHGADFARFAYAPDAKAPTVAAPALSPETLAARDAALKAMEAPMAKLLGKVRGALKR